MKYARRTSGTCRYFYYGVVGTVTGVRQKYFINLYFNRKYPGIDTTVDQIQLRMYRAPKSWQTGQLGADTNRARFERFY